MSIASSRFYVATAYDGTLELWHPNRDIRTVHTVPGIVIRKVECNHQGGIALTDEGKVIFFDHSQRLTYQTTEIITDISSSELDLIMTTRSGRFIRMGKRGNFLKTAPPPLQVSIGPAKIAHITLGKLWVNDQLINHPESITHVSVGGGHTVFLNSKGELYGFGSNLRGQLGMEYLEFTQEPVRISFISSISKVVTGNEHTVILDTDSNVWISGLTDSIPRRHGFRLLRHGVMDVHARGNLTILLFTNGDIEQLGIR